MEQMPRNVDVGSGQGSVVWAGTTPSTDGLFNPQEHVWFFFFLNITQQQLYENCWAGLEINFYPPLSSGFGLPAFCKKHP